MVTSQGVEVETGLKPSGNIVASRFINDIWLVVLFYFLAGLIG